MFILVLNEHSEVEQITCCDKLLLAALSFKKSKKSVSYGCFSSLYALSVQTGIMPHKGEFCLGGIHGVALCSCVINEERGLVRKFKSYILSNP